MKPKTGFSLIELLIAITIVAVISAIGISTFSQSQMRARDSKRKQDLRSIAVALELYRQKHNHFPCTSAWINSYPAPSGTAFWITNDGNCGAAAKPFDTTFINQLPVDPTNNAQPSYDAAGLNYSYGYWAASASCNGKTGFGVTYLLVAQLENKTDPDRVGAKNQVWCNGGGALYSGIIPSATAFVIAGQ